MEVTTKRAVGKTLVSVRLSEEKSGCYICVRFSVTLQEKYLKSLMHRGKNMGLVPDTPNMVPDTPNLGS